MKNNYFLGTLGMTKNIVDLIIPEVSIKGIIGLEERETDDKISDYIYLKEFCRKRNLEFHEVKNYSLKNENDKEKLGNLEIDVLFVMGWQRLIPSWLIEQCKLGVVGAHGSSEGIEKGRGRSPMNWALILGKDKFYISLFEIEKGIDSGDIIDTRNFPISKYDDILRMYQKESLIVAEMIKENFGENAKKIKKRITQKGETRYYPQRLPEDSEIDWNRKPKEVYNFIRGLTKPYPCAYSSIHGTDKIVKILEAKPFDMPFLRKGKAGEVVNVFENNDLLVACNNGFLLADNYNSRDYKLKGGDILNSANFRKQLEKIVSRHYKKYPHLKITKEITKLL